MVHDLGERGTPRAIPNLNDNFRNTLLGLIVDFLYRSSQRDLANDNFMT